MKNKSYGHPANFTSIDVKFAGQISYKYIFSRYAIIYANAVWHSPHLSLRAIAWQSHSSQLLAVHQKTVLNLLVLYLDNKNLTKRTQTIN